MLLLFLFISSVLSGFPHKNGTYSIYPPITENCLPLAPDMNPGINFIKGAINQLLINESHVTLLLTIDPSVWNTLSPMFAMMGDNAPKPDSVEYEDYKAYLSVLPIPCAASWSVDSDGNDVVALSGGALASVPPEQLVALKADPSAYNAAKNLLPYVFAGCTMAASGVLTFDAEDYFSGFWVMDYGPYCSGSDADGQMISIDGSTVFAEKWAKDSCDNKNGNVWGQYGDVPPYMSDAPTSSPTPAQTVNATSNSSAVTLVPTLAFASLLVLAVHV